MVGDKIITAITPHQISAVVATPSLCSVLAMPQREIDENNRKNWRDLYP